MSFKESLTADLAVFLNASEFAEPHNIRFDGEFYEDVVCILTHIKEEDRSTRMSDHAQGIYLASTSLHYNIADTDGNIPEKGTVIAVSDGKFMRDYYVAERRVAEGMAILSLEALDE